MERGDFDISEIKSMGDTSIQEEFYTPKFSIPLVRSKNMGYKKGFRDIFCVQIFSAEYERCIGVGKTMWCNSKIGNWGKGHINTKDDPSGASRVGKIGEMGFGKIAKLPVDVAYRYRGDNGDFNLNTPTPMFHVCKIEIKTTKIPFRSYRNFDFQIRCENDYGNVMPIESDVYVCAGIDYDGFADNIPYARVIFYGWATKEDVMNGEVKNGTAKNSLHKNRTIPVYKIRPFSELINDIEASRI